MQEKGTGPKVDSEPWEAAWATSTSSDARPTKWGKDENDESYIRDKVDVSSGRLGRRIQANQMKCAKGHDMSAAPVYTQDEGKKCVECGVVEIVGLAVVVSAACDITCCMHCTFEPKEKSDQEVEHEGEEEEKQAVRDLLEKAKLTEFTEKILNEGYDVNTLANISREGCDELGMKSGHRTKLRKALEE